MRDITSVVWETTGKWAAQRVQCGRVKAKLGRRTKDCPLAALVKAMVCNDALHVVVLYGPGDKISLFLQDWELAKMDGNELSHCPGQAMPGIQ